MIYLFIFLKKISTFFIFLFDKRAGFAWVPFSRWAVVQLAGRRILAPLIKVRVLAAQPSQLHSASPSSSRPRTTAFHAVDRGSNPLGDANKRSSVERAFESKFCAFFLFDRLPFSKAFSAAAEQSGRGVLSPSRCVRGLTDPPPPNIFSADKRCL